MLLLRMSRRKIKQWRMLLTMRMVVMRTLPVAVAVAVAVHLAAVVHPVVACFVDVELPRLPSVVVTSATMMTRTRTMMSLMLRMPDVERPNDRTIEQEPTTIQIGSQSLNPPHIRP
jgi:hypothetical protein